MVVKQFALVALFALTVGGAQAQPADAAEPRAEAMPSSDRGSFNAGASGASLDMGTVPSMVKVVAQAGGPSLCGEPGQAACDKTPARDAAVAADVTPPPSSTRPVWWAALAVVAFLALRRRPRA